MPGLLYSVPLTPWQAIVNPYLCQRFLDTHRQVWVSLLWSHCSFLLDPGAHKVFFFCTLQESVSPILCKFWKLCGEVTGTLLQEGLCHTEVWCIQSLCPCDRPLLTYTSTADILTLKCRSVWLCLYGISWYAHGFVWALHSSLLSLGFDSKQDFTPPTILLGLLLCLWEWVVFFFLFWWDPTFSCWWLFSNKLQFLSSHRRR